MSYTPPPSSIEAQYFDAIARINAICAAAEIRMKESPLLLESNYHPHAWMTGDEQAEWRACETVAMELERQVMGDPHERCLIKRALRRAEILFDPQAPLSVLRNLESGLVNQNAVAA